jgi:hypothetical protein
MCSIFFFVAVCYMNEMHLRPWQLLLLLPLLLRFQYLKLLLQGCDCRISRFKRYLERLKSLHKQSPSGSFGWRSGPHIEHIVMITI